MRFCLVMLFLCGAAQAACRLASGTYGQCVNYHTREASTTVVKIERSGDHYTVTRTGGIEELRGVWTTPGPGIPAVRTQLVDGVEVEVTTIAECGSGPSLGMTRTLPLRSGTFYLSMYLDGSLTLTTTDGQLRGFHIFSLGGQGDHHEDLICQAI